MRFLAECTGLTVDGFGQLFQRRHLARMSGYRAMPLFPKVLKALVSQKHEQKTERID
jgi:hypothetical protein